MRHFKIIGVLELGWFAYYLTEYGHTTFDVAAWFTISLFVALGYAVLWVIGSTIRWAILRIDPEKPYDPTSYLTLAKWMMFPWFILGVCVLIFDTEVIMNNLVLWLTWGAVGAGITIYTEFRMSIYANARNKRN